MTDNLRIGVIGVNGIGNWHFYSLRQSERSSATAVCDIDPARAGEGRRRQQKLPRSPIRRRCTPAARSTPSSSRRRRGPTASWHATRSTPACTSTARSRSRRLPTRAMHSHVTRVKRERTLQVGFQFRFHTGYAAAREAVADLGELSRVNLTATNWFRAQAYFDESPWRATWAMAGGGVLMNQAVHQVDAMIATAGMPSRVQARVRVHAPPRRDRGRRDRDARVAVGRDRCARRVARGPGRLRTHGVLRRRAARSCSKTATAYA